MRCSRIEETSVGEALASAYVRTCLDAAVRAGMVALTRPVTAIAPTAERLDCRNAFLNIVENLREKRKSPGKDFCRTIDRGGVEIVATMLQRSKALSLESRFGTFRNGS